MAAHQLALLLAFVLLAGCASSASPSGKPLGALTGDAGGPPLSITNPDDEPAKTTLYFHVLDALNENYINTQEPDPAFQVDSKVGLSTSSLTCLDNVYSSAENWHHFFAISSPGYVQYNKTGTDGKPRIHSERGLSYDVRFDGDTFTLVWYLSTGFGVPGVPQPDPYVVLPNVAVHAWMRSGEDISIGNVGYTSGELIAEGETWGTLGHALATQKADDSPGELAYHPATSSEGDEIAVYEYKLTMNIAKPVIKKEGGYNIQIAVYQKDVERNSCQGDDGTYKLFTPNAVKIHTSKDFRPRMELSILSGVRIEYMHPQFIGDELVIHTASNSPWGNYDVDEVATDGTGGTKGGIELTIDGPGEARSVYRAAVVQRYDEHDHHTEAVDVTFVWPYKADGVDSGVFTVNLVVQNDQHTATAVGTTAFDIGNHVVKLCGGLDKSQDGAEIDSSGCVDEKQGPDGKPLDGGAKASPSLELLALLGTLGAVAAVVRRRA